MRSGEPRIRRVALAAIAMSALALSFGCFGVEPEPTPTSEPITALPTATPLSPTPAPTPLPPTPVMPRLPTGFQPPERTVRLTVIDTPAPSPSPSPIPDPTVTPAPTASPTVTPVPTATAVPTAKPNPTPEPTATPEPLTVGMELLLSGMDKLAQSRGYRQETTFTYRFKLQGGERRERQARMSFAYLKPDLTHGNVNIVGLTGPRTFTGLGNEIYSEAHHGYDVKLGKAMHLGPMDALACTLLLCDSPENLRAARSVMGGTDAQGKGFYQILAYHERVGHPHVTDDPARSVVALYRLSDDDGMIQEAQFTDLPLDSLYFGGPDLAGLGIEEFESMSLDIQVSISEIEPDRHIAQPRVTSNQFLQDKGVSPPYYLTPPVILGVDVYAGSLTSPPNDPAACTLATCGGAEVSFAEPVLTFGDLYVYVDGKGYLGCARGCSPTEPAQHLMFYGSPGAQGVSAHVAGAEGPSVWIAPGDVIVDEIIRHQRSAITNPHMVPLLDYYLGPVTASLRTP